MTYQSDTTARAAVDILELLEAHTAPLECCAACGCLCRAYEVCPNCHRRPCAATWGPGALFCSLEAGHTGDHTTPTGDDDGVWAWA